MGWFQSPVTPRHFAWQAWHLVTSTCVSRGRRGTISHPPSFCVAGVALMALGGALGLRDAYVTSTLVSQTISHTSLSHTISHHLSQCVVTHHLSYNLCQQFSHAHLCHTPSSCLPLHTILFTHTSSQTIFHTQLCRTPSFTYYLSQVALAQAKANGAENSCLPI